MKVPFKYRYTAFLSYPQRDCLQVERLMSLVEEYHCSFATSNEAINKAATEKEGTVTSSFSTSNEAINKDLTIPLSLNIKQCIKASKSLLYFCCDECPPPGCEYELKTYMDTHDGKERNIIPICLNHFCLLPQELRRLGLEREYVIDVSKVGEKEAARLIAARLLHVSQRDLENPSRIRSWLRRYFVRYKAFISYRRSDATEEGLRIRVALNELGIPHERVFLDERSLGSGDWLSTIKAAIFASEYFIWLVSPETYVKREGTDFYLQELETALKHRIKIIPVLCKNAELDEDKLKIENNAHLLKKLQKVTYNYDGVGYSLMTLFRNDERGASRRKMLQYLLLLAFIVGTVYVSMSYWSDLIADKVYQRMLEGKHR